MERDIGNCSGTLLCSVPSIESAEVNEEEAKATGMEEERDEEEMGRMERKEKKEENEGEEENEEDSRQKEEGAALTIDHTDDTYRTYRLQADEWMEEVTAVSEKKVTFRKLHHFVLIFDGRYFL